MEGTELWLPPDLPYPITISSLALQPSSQVSRGTRLLTYSFTFKPTTPNSKPSETRFGTWDSTTDGTLLSWKVKRGDIISRPSAVVAVNEPCKHSVQIGGLCAVCGKDITQSDYMGSSYASRATIQMTHSGKGPTVSLEEAQQLERETAAHLLQQRKLSLIVDLDQTIVHATVDPTIGEWIVEGEAWEARHSDPAPAADDDNGDLVNPNWSALKDVAKFVLGPEATGQHPRNAAVPKFSLPGCTYYIKPRPGLQNFLEKMNETFEMHVYTMGTRAYAEAVCTAIDPNGTFFRDRILSRDESGSLTQKSLQRLFPCDQSMVVIIDDRADVWEWSPNLLKVRPYDFFVGIGDINSTLLPKPLSLAPSQSLAPNVSSTDPQDSTEPSPKETATALATQNKITSERIAAQVEERPLAKKQELLEEEDEAEKNEEAIDGSEPEVGSDAVKHEKHGFHHRKALLKNDDNELTRVASLLEEVHKRFYDAYDARRPGFEYRAGLTNGLRSHGVPYDVRTIIPRIRLEPSAGRRINSSGAPPLTAEFSMSESFRTNQVEVEPCTAPQSSPTLTSPHIHITPPDEEEDFATDSVGVDFDADIWADANAEVDEVLGEETEDESGSSFPADEAGDDNGWRSDASNASSLSNTRRKRKRSRSSSVSLSAPVSNEAKAFPLPKRMKTLGSRHSAGFDLSRSKVNREGSSRNDTGEDVTTAEVEAEEIRDNESTTSADGDSVVDIFDDNDDFLAKELEQELERALEQDQEDGG